MVYVVHMNLGLVRDDNRQSSWKNSSRPNCQACSGRRAGNWRDHSRESIYSDKRLVVSGNGRQKKAPQDLCIRNEAETSLGTRSSLVGLVKQ
jgi:hypothetical protein